MKKVIALIFVLLITEADFVQAQAQEMLGWLRENNVEPVKHLLPAMLAGLVEKSHLTIHVNSKKIDSFKYSDIWKKASKRNLSSFKLDEKSRLRFSSHEDFSGGSPFGNQIYLNREISPDIKGRKLLWNVHFAQWGTKNVLYQTNARWVKRSVVNKSAQLSLFRSFFPKSIKNTTRGRNFPLHRELVGFTRPHVLTDYLIDYEEYDEDIFSRTIYVPWAEQGHRSSLRLARGDFLLGGPASLDLLYGFFDHPELFQAKVTGERLVFAPELCIEKKAEEGELPIDTFGRGNAKKLFQWKISLGSDSCLDVREWGIDRKLSFGKIMPLSPIGVSFLPKQMWILSLKSRDPWRTDANITLYVEKESLLPVFAIAHQLDGKRIACAIYFWGILQMKNEMDVAFLTGSLFIADRAESFAQVTSTKHVLIGGNELQSSTAYNELKKFFKREQ